MTSQEQCAVKCMYKHLAESISTLRVLHTWASFEGGELCTPVAVANLCEKTLKNIDTMEAANARHLLLMKRKKSGEQ